MTSLYKRATPSQARLIRAIEGAIKNAGDAHPEEQISPRMARSIAKRAAGTIHSQMGEIVGSSKSKRLKLSVKAAGVILTTPKAKASTNLTGSVPQPEGIMAASLRQSQVAKAAGKGSQIVKAHPAGGAILTTLRIAPLVRLEKKLCKPLRKMKDAGQAEAVDAYIDVLKIIAKLKAEC